MATFSVDKQELIDFINAILNDSPVNNDTFAANKITIDTDEPYLNNRANFFKKELTIDQNFRSTVSKLDNICKSNSCINCPINKYCNTYILEQQKKSLSSHALTMIDLFCGAGGLSLGFGQEGFITTLANDILECCVDTYAHNHPETPRSRIILGDVKDIETNISDWVQPNTVDVIVGGPPCQGFSMANRQRLIDDPRNHLYKSFVNIVKSVLPRFFVMENVKGMLNVSEQVKEDFRGIGYSVECHILNAKDYGVPQNRERLIYIGNKIGINNEEVFRQIFNLSKNIPKHYLKDALFGLRPLKALRVKNGTELNTEESGHKIEARRNKTTNEYINYINQGRCIKIICNHKARYNNDRDIEIFGRMYQGDKSDDPKIADIMPYKSRNDIFKDKYYKLVEESVCKTITAHMKFDCNMYIHPTQARGLTPREAARVQSYPDDYFFRGSYTKTYLQIGNSVPPLLGRAIASVIKKYL